MMSPAATAAAPSMLVLPPELTHDQATASLRMLMQAMRAHKEPQLVVDAGPLKVFDSSAIAVLLECRRAALEYGKGFAVKALPPSLHSLASLYGVEELLPASA